MANRDVRLTLYSGLNFTGRNIFFSRGGVAIRDLNAFRFNNVLSSFRSINVVDNTEITLLLFSRTNFQGSIRVFPGNTEVSNLGTFNNATTSLIVIGRQLTSSEINNIRNTGRPPSGILVIDE